jgi:hypothetical protein
MALLCALYMIRDEPLHRYTFFSMLNSLQGFLKHTH